MDHSSVAELEYRHVAERSEAAAVIELLNNPDRRIPVVLVSTRNGRQLITPEAVCDRVAGRAVVVSLSNAASYGLDDVNDRYKVFGGGVRVVPPNPEPSARFNDDQLFLTYAGDNPAVTLDRIERAVRDMNRAAGDESGVAWTSETTSPVAPKPAPMLGAKPSVMPGAKPAAPRHAPAVVAETAANDSVLKHSPDASRARARAAELEAKLTEANEKVSLLEQENADLRERLAIAEKTVQAPVFSDPCEQFLHDMHLAWLARLPENERAERPMRKVSFGPDFAASIASDLVPYAKTVEVAVEVATRDVFTLPVREPHVFRENQTGNSPQRIRSSDNAGAWRAAIARNTAGAPRLSWWEKVDGTVELAKASHHDDFKIR